MERERERRERRFRGIGIDIYLDCEQNVEEERMRRG